MDDYQKMHVPFQPASKTSPVPVIETDRLILRGHKAEDFPHAYAMWSNPEVVKYIGAVPSTPQQTWSRILAYTGHWCFQGFGYWAIEEKSSRSFIGEIGFADFRRSITPVLSPFPEMGWAIIPTHQGQGLAHEALTAALDWAKDHISFSKTFALIAPEHQRSLKLAEKFSFKTETTTTFAGCPTLILSRPLRARIDGETNARVTFERLTAADLPLLHDWLNRGHIAPVWDGAVNKTEMMRRFDQQMHSDNVFGYIAKFGDHPAAYVQTYHAATVGNGWWPQAEEGTWGIDQFIADAAYLNKGWGTVLVKAFTQFVFATHQAKKIMTDPSPSNPRAIRCYLKSGFDVIDTVQTPDGEAVFMMQDAKKTCGEP